MEIILIADHPSTLNGARDFLDKKIHLVCVAVNALTQYGVYATVVGGLTTEEADRYSDEVNVKNETGTLYPRLNLTILPLTVFNRRNDFGNEGSMKRQILDSFTSNEKYIKCSKLIFALERRPDFDIDLAYEIIQKEADEFEFVNTKEIVYYKN